MSAEQRSCTDCGRDRVEINRDATGDLLCLRCYSRRPQSRERFPEPPPWVNRALTALLDHEREHAARPARRELNLTPADRAGRLAAKGLRPLEDPDLDLVRSDCPSCHAGRSDRLGLYRPLRFCRTGEYFCNACALEGKADA